ncbi:hypothetical protein ABIB25_005772 [Nakamurella sp. UYEF19]|uniref:hypothetical protein n=1 Tax=Nakamurella sp. UYEF19 TaxID=1756392 RepID=UPI003399598F
MDRQGRWMGGSSSLLLALVLVAGCSGGGSSPDSVAAASTAGPLAAYRDPVRDPAEDKLVQTEVAACMKRAGFGYMPYLPAAQRQVLPVGDRSWAEKYGYGISTEVNKITPESDPNFVIRQGMSASERKAYDQALYGDGGLLTTASGRSVSIGGNGSGPVPAGPGGPGPAASGPNQPVRPGCFESASTKVFGAAPRIEVGEFDELFKAMQKLTAAIDVDPRVAPKVTAWAGCLADAGHPGLSKIEDAQNSIMKKWSDLNGWKFTPGSGGSGVSIAALGAVSADGKKLDPTKVTALRQEEIALAVKDLDCRVGYQVVHDQVRVELESKFVQDHKAELERYRNSINGGR